jgi:dihydropteroate synthase
MQEFILREIKDTDIENEINRIGFDRSYAHRAVNRYVYKNIKIYDLTPTQANILKQTALSVGTDCATHREVITGKIEKSNCILTGSISQLKKIAEKLQFQPFGLKFLGENLTTFISKSYKNKTKIVGILNLTDNSFSDGGMYNDFESAKNHLLEMISDGADIIDIGAESTKPYSAPVSAEEQLKKLLPIVEFAKDKTTISIDTRSAIVAEECIKSGVHIINDVSGFDYDEKMPDVIAKYNVPIIIQHSKGTPENMQENPQYDDVVEEIFLKLREKINFAKSKGIEKIITDVGIGFGKTRENNFELIRRIEEFKALGYPIMLGISRKSFLQTKEDAYTVAFNALAIERSVDFIRVHNVKMHKQLVDLMCLW